MASVTLCVSSGVIILHKKRKYDTRDAGRATTGANMRLPLALSHRLVGNLECVLDWSDVVVLITSLGEEDYRHFLLRRVGRIKSPRVQAALRTHGGDLGDFLSWIHHGVECINSSPRTPTSYQVRGNADFRAHQKQWALHVTKRRASLEELHRGMLRLHKEVREKLDAFCEENAQGEYSSYSDYSTSTSSEEENEVGEDDDGELDDGDDEYDDDDEDDVEDDDE